MKVKAHTTTPKKKKKNTEDKFYNGDGCEDDDECASNKCVQDKWGNSRCYGISQIYLTISKYFDCRQNQIKI